MSSRITLFIRSSAPNVRSLKRRSVESGQRYAETRLFVNHHAYFHVTKGARRTWKRDDECCSSQFRTSSPQVSLTPLGAINAFFLFSRPCPQFRFFNDITKPFFNQFLSRRPRQDPPRCRYFISILDKCNLSRYVIFVFC